MRGVVVVGAERTGTSMVTEMIHRWGAYAGDPRLLTAPSEYNPRGQWEYAPLWDLLVRLGDLDTGATWWSDDFDQRVRAKLADQGLRSKADALIADLEATGAPWVLKDPALVHFLAFWQHIWAPALYVIPFRHPVEAARSWANRAGGAGLEAAGEGLVSCGLLRWQYHLVRALEATKGLPRLVVNYDGVLREPDEQARRLASFLEAGLGPPRTHAAPERMVEVIDASLRRQRLGEPQPEDVAILPAQIRLYERLVKAGADEPFDASAEFPMPKAWREIVDRVEAPLRKRRRSPGGR